MSDIGSSKAVLLWQHEYHSKWITYPEDKQDIINKAYNKGYKTVTLPDKDPKRQIVLKLDKMFQKNKVSGWEQRIRCCVYDRGFYVWQWKDDDGYYTSYIPGVSIELEACFKQGKNVKFFLHDDYEFDLKKFCQRNKNTGAVRDVMREKIKVDMTPGIERIAHSFKAYLEQKCETDSKSEQRPPKRMKLLESDISEGVDNVPVDEECEELRDIACVFCDECGAYDAVLNQTNLQFNNNKYYRMQLLKEKYKEKYYVWYRWGRVGRKGEKNLIAFHSSLDLAKEEFKKKFKAKTSNTWDNKIKFNKVPGKYDLLKMDYNKKEGDQTPLLEKLSIPPSKLPVAVCNLMEKISDTDMFTKQAAEMKYDVIKNPLGKLDSQQIKDGCVALCKIECILRKGGSGSKLVQACSEYYTRIPHDFGMKTPPVITSIHQVALEMQLLEVLCDAEVAFKMKEKIQIHSRNPLDCLYEILKCEIKVLDPESTMYEVIKDYLQINHGPTHTAYKMEIINVFECCKTVENDMFKDVGNKYLLWHGSRLTNFVGILENGLRIAPPHAPSTGYMFGKGLYFADVSSKSANYCYPTKQKNEGLLLLCEVSLGEENILYSADYNAKEDTKKKGKHSVKGMGKFVPEPTKMCKKSGIKIPIGKPVKVCESPQDLSKYELNYNEYIIYDVNQVKLRYLINVKFIFA